MPLTPTRRRHEANRQRAWMELEEGRRAGLTPFEALMGALDRYDHDEAERRDLEACHRRVKAHLAEGRAIRRVDQYIRECQDHARQS